MKCQHQYLLALLNCLAVMINIVSHITYYTVKVQLYACEKFMRFLQIWPQQIYAIFIYEFLSVKYLVSYARLKYIVRYKFMQPDMASQNSHK